MVGIQGPPGEGTRLGIGDGTVKTHVSSLLGKPGLQSRTQASLDSVRIGLVSPDESGTT